MKTTISTALIFGLFLGAGLGTGCSNDDDGPNARPPEEGDAFLTIVGDANVFLDSGVQQEITVRYHDSSDNPLAGAIDFAISGPAGGAALSRASAVTDNDGKATIMVTAGASGEAAFAVDASAEFADPVSWRFAIHHDEPLGPLDPTGRYRLTSQFDLSSGLPGTVGQVVNTFIDMTDSPDDPATWILDQGINSITDPTVRTIINATRPALDTIVNEALRAAVPGALTDITNVGRDFGLVARKFGTKSTLEIAAAGDVFTSTHTLTHAIFSIQAQSFEYPMSDLGMNNRIASNVTFAMADGSSDIGSHQFPLSYGSLLLFALEHAVIPLADPTAADLATFLTHALDCDAFGAAVAESIGFGWPSLYRGVCVAGLTAASTAIKARIHTLDGTALLLNIGGHSRAMDTNSDRKIDSLRDGAWTGNLSYGTAPAGPLANSTYRGERITN